ncbi:carboxymuconolactone decarboxylase family protein [Fictibacillus iocasae]|uniref:Carboxymuconolactone decarboxylase family protein n=1 Tax=Fictibacillus iocasae TaxID=2715437 RepID=A0ABW2NMR8_9BACL
MSSYINIIENDKATGLLKQMYEEHGGEMANILKVHSLNPQSLRAHLDFYKVLMFKSSPLSRKTREMIATVVSSTNECFY